MSRARATFSVIGVILLCIAITAYNESNDDSREDVLPLPSPPTVPEGATPQFWSSTPLPEAEWSIVAKPVIAADREHLVVVAQNAQGELSRLIAWRSGNRSTSSDWQPLENWPAKARFNGDPWMQTDGRGRFFLVHTTLDGGTLAVRRSNDFAENWSTPQEVAQRADRPVLGISPSGKHLVIAASMVEDRENAPKIVLRGDDPQLQEKLAALTRHFAGIFVSQDRGRTWKRAPGPLPETHAIPFSVVCDDEGRIASAWIAARGIARFNAPRNSRSIVCATRDGGKKWTETELVADLQPDRMHPFNGERFPVLALGPTGVVHVAYVETLAKALWVRSSENWEQWKTPIRLSSDSAEEIRMPAIATSGAMVHVTWMERRNGRWQTWYRGSRNHGKAWSERLLLSPQNESSTLIDELGFDAPADDDQSCITDDGAGTVYVVWTVWGRNASSRIWLASIKWQNSADSGGKPRAISGR